MQKLLIVVTVLIAALGIGLMTGCDQDPTNPPGRQSNDVSSIEMRITHIQITGFVSEERSETITAIARNARGVAVPGVQMEFAIENPLSYRGTLTQTDGDSSLTDANGESKAIFSVVLERSTSVIITAMSGNVSSNITINLELVDDRIGKITIEGPNVLTVSPNSTSQTNVIASLVDKDGVAIPGILVHFKTMPPSLAYISSDTGTTDRNGRVSKTFRTIVNATGICTIYAYIGEFNLDDFVKYDYTTIEITPVAKPHFIRIFTETPNINVMPNQNAKIVILTVVTDEDGIGVPNIPIQFEIDSPVSGGEIYGAITPSSGGSGSGGGLDDNREGEGGSGGTNEGTGDFITNQAGELSAVFSSFGRYGRLIIRVKVLPSGSSGSGGEEIDPAEMNINLELLTNAIGDMTLSIYPSYLNLAPDTIGTAKVSARVIDLNNNGIRNLQVNFKCKFGTMSRATLTDSAGLATAIYEILPITDFPDPQTYIIEDVITASLPGTAQIKTVEITVERAASDQGYLKLSTDTDSIYADGGLTIATLRAELKDAKGMPLKDRTISFYAPEGGQILPEVITDSVGVATNYFYAFDPSLDENGLVVPVVIEAWFLSLGLGSTVHIKINPRQDVAEIRLEIQKEIMMAGSGDSSWVGAICVLANNRPAPAGTEVRFEVDNGRFTKVMSPVVGVFGQAETYFIVPQLVGTAILRAYVINGPDDIKYSPPKTIILEAGPPTTVRLVAVPNELTANDPSAISIITATVSDTAGNHITESVLITFTKTLGILDRENAATDELGKAVVNLMPGVGAGVSVITGTVNTPAGPIQGQTTVTITSSIANRLELSAEYQRIRAAGTSGRTSTTLEARLFDPNGNLVVQPHLVKFEILSQDLWSEIERCNINRHGLSDETQTSGGIANVTLNAGIQSGGVVIRASTFSVELNQLVIIQGTPVQVLAGLPDLIDIDVNSEADDEGGGIWSIEVSARVYDQFQNPVEDNIAVTFSCIPADIAQIGESWTGNENRSQDTEEGVAFAIMQYNSEQTFDSLTIIASIAIENGSIDGERDYVLPLQDPELLLHVSPQNWMIDIMPDANFTCVARLTDGHGVLINHAPVLFASNRGYFHWYDWRSGNYRRYDIEAQPPEMIIKKTGRNIRMGAPYAQHRENRGEATVYLQGEEPDFFLDPVTPEVNIQIEAEVIGYQDAVADPVIVVVTRHP